MTNKSYAPLFKTFHWLRNVNTIDAKSERVLKLVCRRYKKFFVMGNPNAGKNTVSNAMFSFLHEIGREPHYTPTITGKSPSSFPTLPTWKSFKPLLTKGHPVIVPFGYETEYYGEQNIPGLFESARHFDVIVDVRRLPDGHRQVCQIFVRKNTGFRCIYRNRDFARLQIGRAA